MNIFSRGASIVLAGASILVAADSAAVPAFVPLDSTAQAPAMVPETSSAVVTPDSVVQSPAIVPDTNPAPAAQTTEQVPPPDQAKNAKPPAAKPDVAGVSEKPWSVLFCAGVVNKYLWRGQNLHDNVAMQPWVEGIYKNVSAGFQGSYNTGYDTVESSFGRAVYYIGYAYTVPRFDICGLSAKYSLYTYPPSFDTDSSYLHEFSLGASFNVPARPCITYYLAPRNGFNGLASQYLELGGAYSVNAQQNVVITLGATAGWRAVYNEAAGKWRKEGTVIGLKIAGTITGTVNVAPLFFFQFPFGKRYEPDFYFGANISYDL